MNMKTISENSISCLEWSYQMHVCRASWKKRNTREWKSLCFVPIELQNLWEYNKELVVALMYEICDYVYSHKVMGTDTTIYMEIL